LFLAQEISVAARACARGGARAWSGSSGARVLPEAAVVGVLRRRSCRLAAASTTAAHRPFDRAAIQAIAGGRGPKARARPSSVRGVSWAAAQAGGCTRTACHLRHQHVGWAGLIERRRLGAQEWPLGAAQSCSDTRPKVLQATPGKLN